MSDPYFQQLFADRIGGGNYGKGTAIYKFEKIKRAKRKALAEHPERQADRLRHRRKRRNGPRADPRGDGPRDQRRKTAATPTTASPPIRKRPRGSCSATSA